MLVLTRKQQEKIQIGDDIVITVLRTKGKTVRLGIEAPNSVSVLRGELAVRIREEGQAPETAGESRQEDSKRPCSANSSAASEATKQPGSEQCWQSEGGGDAKVSFERAPRSRVASVLPKMLGGAKFSDTAADGHGPLRAMLDRRAGAAI